MVEKVSRMCPSFFFPFFPHVKNWQKTEDAVILNFFLTNFISELAGQEKPWCLFVSQCRCFAATICLECFSWLVS